MKKIIILSIILTIITTTTGFSRKHKTSLLCPQSSTHITANGDVNFDLSGNINASFYQKIMKGKLAIMLTGTILSSDSSNLNKVFVIYLINITKAGSYRITPGKKDSCLAQVSYMGGSNDNDNYLSFQTLAFGTEMPGRVIINSISNTSIDGTYTTKITNKVGKVLNVSGIFSGNIKQL